MLEIQRRLELQQEHASLCRKQQLSATSFFFNFGKRMPQALRVLWLP
jgi:hypothetical protein